MNLSKRIEALEKLYKPIDLKRQEREDAFDALHHALRKALPDESSKQIKSPDYGNLIVCTRGDGLSFEGKLKLLVINIENEAVTDDDQAVLASLPQWALEASGMTPVEYVGIVNGLLNRI